LIVLRVNFDEPDVFYTGEPEVHTGTVRRGMKFCGCAISSLRLNSASAFP